MLVLFLHIVEVAKRSAIVTLEASALLYFPILTHWLVNICMYRRGIRTTVQYITNGNSGKSFTVRSDRTADPDAIANHKLHIVE